jgi:ABC-type proline/glycine betaine transport system permease subunit
MGTNCAPLLADLSVYSYESVFLQKLVKDKKMHEARAFNFTYRYIDDVLSINNSRFAEFLPLIYQIPLRPHHFWTYTSNLTTVVKSVLTFMINGTTSILKSYIFQICAAIYQLLLHMVFTSRNWFVMQGPVAIILISWNVIFIWETGYWTRAIKRFALFDLLKSLYSDTKIFSIYIPSLQKRL